MKMLKTRMIAGTTAAIAASTRALVFPVSRPGGNRGGHKIGMTQAAINRGMSPIRLIATASSLSGDNNNTATNVRQVWKSSLAQLTREGISEPEWSVAHLLASALDLPWSNGFSQLQRAMQSDNDELLSTTSLTPSQLEQYQSMLSRRIDKEPLQYILGKWDFLDYEQLIVRPPLLCPRPETEELVELVRKDTVRQRGQGPQDQSTIRILDVGAGTGVIGIALADAIPQSKVVAIDVEPIAIATSLENAQLVLGPSFDEDKYVALQCAAEDYVIPDNQRLFDVIVSNPPYIPRSDMTTLDPTVVEYESDQALCGGDDGMDVIRTAIYKWVTEWGTKKSVCWMEVDPTHPTLLEQWLQQEESQKHQKLDGVKLESVYQDLSGRDRFVKLSLER